MNMDNMPILDEWLSSILKEGTKAHHERGMRYFTEFMAASPERILEIRKSEPRFETKIVQFYQWMIKNKELSPNSARSNIISVQSFFKYVKAPIDVKGKLPDITMKINEYRLSLADLQSMYRYGDITTKTALNLLRDIPSRIGDLLQLLGTDLKEEQVIISTKEGVPGKCYLSEECLSLLSKTKDQLPKTTDGWNKMLAKAAQDASLHGIPTCHSFRKLWITTAINLGIPTEVWKILTFKKVPKDILTYFLDRNDLKDAWKKVIDALPLEPKNGNGRVTKMEEALDLVLRMLKILAMKEAKAQGLAAIQQQDPLEFLRTYVTMEEAIPPMERKKKEKTKEQSEDTD